MPSPTILARTTATPTRTTSATTTPVPTAVPTAVPDPARSPSGTVVDLDRVAGAIARDGVAHVSAVTDVLASARRRGLGLPSVDVLADVTAPEVVRARAFAHVARALASTAREPRGVATAA